MICDKCGKGYFHSSSNNPQTCESCQRIGVINKSVKHSTDKDNEQIIGLLHNILDELKKLNSKEDSEDFIYELSGSTSILKFKNIWSVEERSDSVFVFDVHGDFQSYFKILEKDRFLKWFEKQKTKGNK